MIRHTNVISTLGLLAAVLSVGGITDRAMAQSTPVTQVRLPITLHPDQRTELRARVEGYVARVHGDIGDRVTEGQLLVTIDAPELEADVRRREQMVLQAQANLGVAEGRVATAEAKLRQAGAALREQASLRKLRQSERDRYESLVRAGAVQREKFEEADYALMSVDAAVATIEADVEAAGADVEAAKDEVVFARTGIEVAKAERDRARAQDQLRLIMAPFSGLVTQRHVDPGQLVSLDASSSKPLLVVERVQVLRGVMTVPADQADLIDVGDQVSLVGFDRIGGVKAPDGGPLKVSRISQSLDMMTRTMRVEIDLSNEFDEKSGRFQLLIGQYGTASIQLD